MTTPGLLPKWSWVLTWCCAIDNSQKTGWVEVLIKRWMCRECNIHIHWDFTQPREINGIIDAAGDHYSMWKKTEFSYSRLFFQADFRAQTSQPLLTWNHHLFPHSPFPSLCSWNIFSLLGEEDLAFYTVILGHIHRCQDCIFFISVSWVFRIAPGPHQLPPKWLKSVWGTGHHIKTWGPVVWALGACDACSHPLPPVCSSCSLCMPLPALPGCAVLLQRGQSFALSRLFVLISFSWTIC